MSKKNLENIIQDLESTGEKPQGLVFPCIYPVKAMGVNTNKFLQEMLFIAQKHCPKTTKSDVSTNISRTGKYQSVTIKVNVDSRKHLETLFIEINNHDDVKWTL